MSNPYTPQDYERWQQQQLPLQADEDYPAGSTLGVANHPHPAGLFGPFTRSNNPMQAPYLVLGASGGLHLAPTWPPYEEPGYNTQRVHDILGGSETSYRAEPVYFPPTNYLQTPSQGPSPTEDLTRVGDAIATSNTLFRPLQQERGNLVLQGAFEAQQRPDIRQLSVQSECITQLQGLAAPLLAQIPGDSSGLVYGTRAGYAGQHDHASQLPGFATPLPLQMSEGGTVCDDTIPLEAYPHPEEWIGPQLPYTKSRERRVSEFVPRRDGPYTLVDLDEHKPTLELDVPKSTNFCDTFRTSTAMFYVEKDVEPLPGAEYTRPGPVTTEDGEEEFFIRDIIDEKRVGRGYRYLVRWLGYGPEDDQWLPRSELEDTEALDIWLAKKRVG